MTDTGEKRGYTGGYSSFPKSRKYAYFGLPEYDVTKAEGCIVKEAARFSDRELKAYVKAFKRCVRAKGGFFAKKRIRMPTDEDPLLRLWSDTGVTMADVERRLDETRK